MLSSPDVETSTSLILSGSGVPGPDAGVGIPAVAAGEAPSPAAWRRSQSPHATTAAGDLTHAPWTTSVIECAPKTVFGLYILLFVYVFLGLHISRLCILF